MRSLPPDDAMVSSAMQKVSLIRDTDGNGSFTSNESVTIRRLIAEISSGFSAYKSTDPAAFGYLDGNFTSNDSVSVQRVIAGL